MSTGGGGTDKPKSTSSSSSSSSKDGAKPAGRTAMSKKRSDVRSSLSGLLFGTMEDRVCERAPPPLILRSCRVHWLTPSAWRPHIHL